MSLKGPKMSLVQDFLREWVLPPKVSRLFAPDTGKPVENSQGSDIDLYKEYVCRRWQLWRDSLLGASRYLEFGCGLSTQFAASNFDCQIRSVETDIVWSDKIQSILASQAEIVHVDLGPVGDWGRPEGYSKRLNFEEYCEVGFRNDYSPDVVLIDGRFRVAAFLTTLVRTAPGTTIVFDDYPGRPHYHVVEEFLSPEVISEDQAVFVRPLETSRGDLLAMRASFLHVMD